MEKPSPKSLKELMKMITPLKGVKRKVDKIPEDDDDPNDEISDGEDNVADNDHVTGEGAST